MSKSSSSSRFFFVLYVALMMASSSSTTAAFTWSASPLSSSSSSSRHCQTHSIATTVTTPSSSSTQLGAAAAKKEGRTWNFNEGTGPWGLKKNAEVWNGRVAQVRKGLSARCKTSRRLGRGYHEFTLPSFMYASIPVLGVMRDSVGASFRKRSLSKQKLILTVLVSFLSIHHNAQMAFVIVFLQELVTGKGVIAGVQEGDGLSLAMAGLAGITTIGLTIWLAIQGSEEYVDLE